MRCSMERLRVAQVMHGLGWGRNDSISEEKNPRRRPVVVTAAKGVSIMGCSVITRDPPID